MIEINLLPSGTQRRAPARSFRGPSLPALGADPRIAGLGAAALLAVVLAGYTFWRTGTELEAVEAKVAEARADSGRMARTIALLDNLRARRDTIQYRIGVIRSVDGRRYVWPHLMDEISRAVPQYTWLTKVQADEEKAPPAPPPAARDSAAKKGKGKGKAKADTLPAPPPPPAGPSFSIEGNAGSPQALTRFMKNLEASPMIQGVSLVTSEQTETEGRSYLRFTLEATYERPDSSMIETVPVVTTGP